MMGKDLDAYFGKLFDYVCFTGQFNFSGGPAASVPFHWTAEGLPVGIQIGADLGNEAVLFRLASQIEAAKPWEGQAARRCEGASASAETWFLPRLLRKVAVLFVLGFLAAARPERARPATIVVDAATGAVLASAQPTALWRPASLTKLMSLYVVFQELAAGHLSLDEKLTVSAYAAAMPPSSDRPGARANI